MDSEDSRRRTAIESNIEGGLHRLAGRPMVAEGAHQADSRVDLTQLLALSLSAQLCNEGAVGAAGQYCVRPLASRHASRWM